MEPLGMKRLCIFSSWLRWFTVSLPPGSISQCAWPGVWLLSGPVCAVVLKPSQQHHPDNASYSGVSRSAADWEPETVLARAGGTQEGVSGGGGAGGLSAEGEGRESSKRTSRKVREVEKGLLTCERFVKECRVSVGWSRVFGQPLFYFHQLI